MKHSHNFNKSRLLSTYSQFHSLEIYLILKFKCFNMFSACIVCQSISAHTSINKSGLAVNTSRTYAYTTNSRPRTFLYLRRTERKPRGDSPEENGASTSCRFSIVSRVPLGCTLARARARVRSQHPALLEEDCTHCNSGKDRPLRNACERATSCCWARSRLAAPQSWMSAPWELAASAAIPSSSVSLPREGSRGIARRASRSIFQFSGNFKRRGNTEGEFHSRARARARSRTHAPRRTLCTADIDRWIAAIHRRSCVLPTPTRLPHPRDTYPSTRTPLSRDSHLASRTSASPGRVSVSGHGGVLVQWCEVTQSRVGRPTVSDTVKGTSTILYWPRTRRTAARSAVSRHRRRGATDDSGGRHRNPRRGAIFTKKSNLH